MHHPLPLTIGDFLRSNAVNYGDRTALVYGSQRITFAEHFQRSLRLASAWHKLGVRRQNRIAVLAQNCLEYTQLYGAGELAGYITATLNFRLAPLEILHILKDCMPRVLVFEEAYAEVVEQLRPELHEVEHFVCIGEAPDWATGFLELLESGDASGPPCAAREDDIAYLIYTSGTTGRPKGSILGQREFRRGAQELAAGQGCTSRDRNLLMMPLFHIGAKGIQNAQHSVGGEVHLLRGLDMGTILQTIERERITLTHMAPTIVQALLESPLLPKHDVSSLRMIFYAAAPMPMPVLKRGMELFGPGAFANCYGQTEVGGTILQPEDHRPDGTERERRWLASVGRPFGDTMVRIVDDAGAECQVGSPGEILFKTQAMFRGYWNNSVATSDTIRDGWCHTGDVGKLDADGFLYLVDRKKDMIISGGENIYSREVEEALVQHPAVREVAVIGVPDEKWGEAVCAIVVLRETQKASAEELIEFSRTQIASYKKPRQVIFADELPRLPSGKVAKIELRKRYGGK